MKDGDVPEDFKGRLVLILKTDDLSPSYKEIEVRAIEKPNLSLFTSREIKILEDLAFIYKKARGRDISEVTHLPKQPWDITVKKYGKNKLIDYTLGIDEKSEVSPDDAMESLKEHFEAVRNFDLKPTATAEEDMQAMLAAGSPAEEKVGSRPQTRSGHETLA
ncbi:MAG: hypothetical protein IIB38_13455 [Candidatus Hydrogenedentes bacterium]|nr:hypothetical protein [Candidatus Hydrogenedentota bacterium]